MGEKHGGIKRTLFEILGIGFQWLHKIGTIGRYMNLGRIAEGEGDLLPFHIQQLMLWF